MSSGSIMMKAMYIIGWKNTLNEMLSNRNICNNTSVSPIKAYVRFFCISKV